MASCRLFDAKVSSKSYADCDVCHMVWYSTKNVQIKYTNMNTDIFFVIYADYMSPITAQESQLGPVSIHGAKEAFPWKILTEMIYYLIYVEKFWS